MTVGIVNYGVGNIGSLMNMFKKLEIDVQVVSTPEDMMRMSRLVLPGVGAYDHAMGELDQRGLTEPLTTFRASGKYILGVCLGMQLLVDSSDEGVLSGLGFISGTCKRLGEPAAAALRIPHMGWNKVTPRQGSQMLAGLAVDSRFYFVHSYFVDAPDSVVLATTKYGIDFASIIGYENVNGAQFHPEKSHAFGMTLLENWAHM